MPSPFCKPLTMDVCKVISWVPYKMVALGQGGKCAGGFPTPIQLPSQIFEKRKEKSAAGFSSPHCPWCDSHSHVDHIAFHKLETSIATFHSGFRRIPLAGSAKIIRKKTFNRHPCLHCVRYAIMGRWWRCNSITMGVASSLSPADADVVGLLDREGVDQVDIALELTA